MNVRALLLVLTSLAAGLSAQVLPLVPPEQVGLSAERLARIRPAMERYIQNNEMAGATGLIARHGKIAYFETWGQADREANKPMAKDAIFRMYSMTKAVTGVAVMTLYEEGRFFLHDTVAKYLPEFQDMKVAVESTDASGKKSYRVVPAERPIEILDLLRHTSGLNYAGAPESSGVPNYKSAGIPSGTPAFTLAEFVKKIASVPLVHQPATTWDYSVSIDVLARLVEVVSGQPVDQYYAEHIFKPLKMVDTGYYVPEAKWNRLTALYDATPGTLTRTAGAAQEGYKKNPVHFGGGTGLVSTTMDYARFVQMLLNGGQLDGVRILSPKTVELMHANHLGDLPAVNNVNGRVGYGFGLTFAVNKGVGKTGAVGSEGEYNWGGAAGTAFWIDPKEDMVGVFMVQVMPMPFIKDRFKQLAYQAIVGDGKK